LHHQKHTWDSWLQAALQADGCLETPLSGKRGSDDCLTERCLRCPPAKDSPQQKEPLPHVLSWPLFGQRRTQCRVGQPYSRHCADMNFVMLPMYSTPMKTVRTEKKIHCGWCARKQLPRGRKLWFNIAYTGVAWRESYCCDLTASRPCGGSSYQLRSVAFSPPVSHSRRSLLLRMFSPEEHPSTPPSSLSSSPRPTALMGWWPRTMQ